MAIHMTGLLSLYKRLNNTCVLRKVHDRHELMFFVNTSFVVTVLSQAVDMMTLMWCCRFGTTLQLAM